MRPVLSPAYDIVPTVAFGDDTMAMKLGGTVTPGSISLHRFERAAAFVDMEPRALTNEVKRTVERAADQWPGLLAELPASDLRDMLRQRWSRLQLTAGVANPF